MNIEFVLSFLLIISCIPALHVFLRKAYAVEEQVGRWAKSEQKHVGQAMLHGTGIRIQGYEYGDTVKRHFLKIDLRRYGKYMYNFIRNQNQ